MGPFFSFVHADAVAPGFSIQQTCCGGLLTVACRQDGTVFILGSLVLVPRGVPFLYLIAMASNLAMASAVADVAMHIPDFSLGCTCFSPLVEGDQALAQFMQEEASACKCHIPNHDVSKSGDNSSALSS